MTKGWKTSEFWLTALFNLSALLTLVAGVLPAQTAPLVVAAAGIVTALYNFGRSLVKSADARGKAQGASAVNTSGTSNALAGMVAAVTNSSLSNAPQTTSPQRRATDKVGTRDVVGALERVALEGVLNGGSGDNQGSEVFDERNAG